MTSSINTDQSTSQAPDKLTVFYNGSCSICGPEVAYYRQCAETDEADISFEDVAHPSSELYERVDYLKRFHVRQGEIEYSGIEAFIMLWRQLPQFRWLARLVSLPIIRPVGAVIYDHVLAPLLYWRFRRQQDRNRPPQANQENGRADNQHKSVDQ